ncbi:hypothetical protein MCOR27_005125 [Pyricularia oryzae]|uniref:Uncharacterized protein n=1 Tax=Pyricularia grisea TaxID=148305 RepID=A0ABQ8NGJ6_PYRGI|nr:hypothetical protein MCOR01_011597 [Pyricularia oryzae]KAI6296749.1 hypothetical protein MCOR33_006740 [Pyricularia grisea]KAI6276399.1 hypothetical protein MCOR26_005613 [Pyricularia oryzae]KAI6279505.1 hypothetical protein MCOR27_005125 [Pyricularia oryzae]KAI6308991.1 hypothetical protein MCOR29_009067 [Pyricularia oryzae]
MQPNSAYQKGTLNAVISQPAESSAATLHPTLPVATPYIHAQAPDVACQEATVHTAADAYTSPNLQPPSSQKIPLTPPQEPPEPTATIDERLEYMLDCAETAGFDSLDCLFEAYYGSTITAPQSCLANMRRLSRNRRLPKLLAALFKSSQSWSMWERQKLFEKIFKIAETLLIAEGRETPADSGGGGATGVKVLQEVLGLREVPRAGAISEAGDPQNARGGAALRQNDIKRLKMTVQNELPNMWALVTALTSGDKGLRHRDRSDVVLATILTLFGAGRMPKDSLFQALDSIL